MIRDCMCGDRCRFCNPLDPEKACICPHKKPRYYVYALCKEDGTFFYVGKGSRLRFKEHEKRANSTDALVSRKIRSLRSSGIEIKHLIIARTDDEETAFLIERLVISQFPPRFLCNRTQGGDGVRGYSPSEEVRRKMSERMKGNKHGKGWGYTTRDSRKRRTPESYKQAGKKSAATMRARGIPIGNRGNNKGHRHSPGAIENMRRAQSNRAPISEEARKKMSLAKIGTSNRLGTGATDTHCRNGHEYANGNAIFYGPERRWRKCRTCRDENNRQHKTADAPRLKVLRHLRYLAQKEAA